jgi:hypothetical protein
LLAVRFPDTRAALASLVGQAGEAMFANEPMPADLT